MTCCLVLLAALSEVEDELPNFAMEFAPENGTPVHMQHEAGAMDLQKPLQRSGVICKRSGSDIMFHQV